MDWGVSTCCSNSEIEFMRKRLAIYYTPAEIPSFWPKPNKIPNIKVPLGTLYPIDKNEKNIFPL